MESVALDIERSNSVAASGSLKALLNELKASSAKHINEPALTILREEVEALLNLLPPKAKIKPKPKQATKPKR